MEKTVGWGKNHQTMWAQRKEPVPISPQALVVPGLEKVNGGSETGLLMQLRKSHCLAP